MATTDYTPSDGTLANLEHRYTLPIASDGGTTPAPDLASDVRGTLVYLKIGTNDIEVSDTIGSSYGVDYAVARIVDPVEFPTGTGTYAIGDLITVISSIILCKDEGGDWAFA